MYDLENLTGDIVTMKLTNGIELLAQLLSTDEDNNYFTLGEPRIVVINGADLALIPYVFTCDTVEVVIPASAVLSINKSSEDSTADYEKLVSDIVEDAVTEE
jgi:hypothetical protein